MVALDPQHAEANHRLGVLECQSGQTDPGLAHLHTAVDCAPASVEFRLALANALLQAQRPLDAQAVLDAAPVTLPNTPAVTALRQQLTHSQSKSTCCCQPRSAQRQARTGAEGSGRHAAGHDCRDVRVCVPADIHAQTTYVLLEQGDWYDAEMTFVRQFIQPGMVAVDLRPARRVCPDAGETVEWQW
ncbi:tetratricopeptide repeat protein [Chromatium okenii]|uniref:Uncharacterized protein n=1 Tax=Chromatium okenii TaxID=61644 RepID=A0A2S7XQ86_9GAMM|nr:tetratricopeptide repeat protein [Chromatium okenii]PQJ95909.1 hypothetical protein CXB77_08490 [Chromatium okenii]